MLNECFGILIVTTEAVSTSSIGFRGWALAIWSLSIDDFNKPFLPVERDGLMQQFSPYYLFDLMEIMIYFRNEDNHVELTGKTAAPTLSMISGHRLHKLLLHHEEGLIDPFFVAMFTLQNQAKE
ncbi:hypothetical protein Nepgr_017972 [Nepenthes gracilis]|uniref:Uncharacterized protein n=1 Tax=Nepenthes gracilis TaxID=150966 RepID=A0AAD3STT0_NEPGR|nr:hypothetical protein Nepgr_017972 [Nepenthes gracilis]